MKITIMASGHLSQPKIYDLEAIGTAPNVGDTVMIGGKPFEVCDRVFNLEKAPVEVALLCKPKLQGQ